MCFKFLGKKFLLDILRDKSFNPFIDYGSVIYRREELFNDDKIETIVYIDNDIHYKVIYEYSVKTKHSKIYYEEIKHKNNDFTIKQRIIIYESEDDLNESDFS